MKLTTRIKQPARPDSTTYLSRYLKEIIDCGGEFCTRAEAIRDMQEMGMDQPCIDRWLQGNEFMARLRRRHEQASVQVFLEP